ncbi:MAG: hypothetical protein PVJ49_02280 [Acidobacteriota bacterium]|jgi:hypothetical protein
MLRDQSWNPISIHRVVLNFLRSEPHHWQDLLPERLHRVVDDPDLDSGEQNAARWRLLHYYRRYLVGEIPPDTAWYEVRHLEDAHLAELMVISRSAFFNGPPFDLREVSARKPIPLQTPPEQWQPPILWGHSEDGPFTILEGNHRLTAYAAAPTGTLSIPSYVGISTMPCHWHALDPPRELVHDMWR